MIHGVAQQMHQRIGDGIEQRAIELHLLAADHQLDLLARPARRVPYEPGEPIEDLPDRHHTTLDHMDLQLGHQPARPLDQLLQGV